MDIMVAAIAAFITIFVLYGLNIDKTSSQLMLLGIELTVLGGVFKIPYYSKLNLQYFLTKFN